jgi:opacity protein-like surface antigen
MRIRLFGSVDVIRKVVLIGVITLSAANPLSASDNPAPIADMEPILRDAARMNGAPGLRDALELLLSGRPALLADSAKAADVMTLAGRILMEEDKSAKPDFGALSSIIITAAPPADRADIAYSVTNAVVDLLTPDMVVDRQVAPVKVDRRVAAGDETEPPSPVANDQKAEKQPAPLRVGRFLLYPDITASGVYDSNIFATRNDREDDLIAVVSPYFEAESSWARHYLNLKAGAEIGRYDQRTTEDYEDYWTSLDGRLDLSDRTNLFGGGNYERLHESRESPDNINGIEPTTYEILGSYGGITQKVGRLKFRLGGTFQKVDYNPVPTSEGLVSNSDRDRKLYTGGLRTDLAITPRFGLFAQAAADIRRYQLETPDAAYDRDSDGGRYLAGINFKPSDKIKIEVFSGYLNQNYDDPLLDSVDAMALGGSVYYKPDGRSTVTMFADRSVTETTLAGASSLLSTVVGVDFEHVVAPRTWFRTNFAYSRGEYQGIDRDDDVVNAETSLQYYLNPYLFMEMAYRFRHLHSTTEIEDYDRHQVILRLGGQLYAADTDMPAGKDNVFAGSERFAGGYAGVQVGYGGLDSDVSGPRGADNTTTFSDFGRHGATWGIYTGYGVVLDPVYLGIEFEGEASTNDWSFDRGEEIRQFSVRKRLAYGVGGRVGYPLSDNALFYGRAGIVRAEFITQYALGTTLIDTDFTKTGLRFGGGAEIPLNQRLLLRLDYVFTDYGAYEIDYESGTDVFSNSENLFRVGAAYRL